MNVPVSYWAACATSPLTWAERAFASGRRLSDGLWIGSQIREESLRADVEACDAPIGTGDEHCPLECAQEQACHVERRTPETQFSVAFPLLEDRSEPHFVCSEE